MEKVIDIIQSYSGNTENIKRWFGRFITEPKNDTDEFSRTDPYSAEQLREILANFDYVCRSEYARFSFIKNSNDTSYLYVNGHEYLLENSSQSIAPAICNQRRINSRTILSFINSPECEELVIKFFNNGYLYFEE